MRSPRAILFFVGLGITGLAACGARSSLRDASPGREPREEQCNGVDDDLNGAVDDAPTLACGVGACRVERPGCAGGAPALCEPGSPSKEVCNGVDDDCDGAVDEGLGFGPVAGPFTVDSDPRGIASTSLVVTPTGLLAVWATWYDGDAPEPNTFARPLGPDAQPAGAAVPVLKRIVSFSLRAAPSNDSAIVLTYCGLDGFEGRATSAFLDGTGTLLGEEIQRSPGGRTCTSSTLPDGVWTGDRHLFAWLTGVEGASNDLEVLLDIADSSGKSVEHRAVFSDAPSRPARLAVAPGRVAVTSTHRESDGSTSLLAAVLDASGAIIAGPLNLGPPAPGSAWQHPAPVATNAGDFFILGENTQGADGPVSGLVRAKISRDGAILEPPTILEGTDWHSDALEVVARGGGGFVATGYRYDSSSDGSYVLALSDDGQVTGAWLSDPGVETFFFASSIAVRDGRVFVLYEAAAPGMPYELRVREFGCVP